MLLEAVTFLAAAAIHAGFLVEGYEHREARMCADLWSSAGCPRARRRFWSIVWIII
jgi:hypothetical protein